MELYEHKKRMSALENLAETKPTSSDPDIIDIIKLIKNAPGKFVFTLATQI